MNKNKETIIAEFERMKVFEKWASGFYAQVSDDPRIQDGEVKEVFKKVGQDEEEHSEIVQKILNITQNCL